MPSLCRSVLYVPASNPKAIEKARCLACDVVVLDLEDGVTPEAKTVARENAKAIVSGNRFGERTLVVRVNGRDTEWGAADMAAFVKVMPAAILFTKVNSGADLFGYEAQLGPDCTAVSWVMIETAKSILSLNEIAMASSRSRLTCLVMGTNDLAKELGAKLDAVREPFLGLLGMAVVAARAYGLEILDGVFNDIDDATGFNAQCEQAASFGFGGKTLIHPVQIGPCNASFTPDAAPVEWALRVVSAFDEPENANKGVIRLAGKMVERLHLAQAHHTLAIARAAEGAG